MKWLMFIGRTKNDTVYFDFKTKKALVVRGLKNLDMQELKKSGEKAGGYSFTLTLVLVGLVALFRKQLNITESLTPKVIFILIALNIIGAIVLVYYIASKAYPSHQEYELATDEEFNEAFVGNIYFTFNKKTVFKDKWIDLLGSQLFYLFIIATGLVSPIFLFKTISSLLGLISVVPCMLMTGAGLGYILLYNKFLYLKVENLYHEHKIVFKES